MPDYTRYRIAATGNPNHPEQALTGARPRKLYVVYRTRTDVVGAQESQLAPALFGVLLLTDDTAVLFPEGVMRLESRAAARDAARRLIRWAEENDVALSYGSCDRATSERIRETSEFTPSSLRDLPDDVAEDIRTL